jgi:DNA repair ATPase RecN
MFRRSAKVNEYTVSTVGGETQVYSKVGGGLLDFLQELGFDVVVTDRKDVIDVIFQEQLKPLFLIGESPVYVTSFLNEVFQISKYEVALRSATRDLALCTKEYNESVERLENDSRDLVEVSAQVQAKQDQVRQYTAARDSLSESLDKYRAVLQARKDKDAQVEIESSVRTLEDKLRVDRKFGGVLLRADTLVRQQQYLATQKDSLLGLEREILPLTKVVGEIKAYIDILNTLLLIFKVREGLLRLKGMYCRIGQESQQVSKGIGVLRDMSSVLYEVQRVREQYMSLKKVYAAKQALDSSLQESADKIQELKSLQANVNVYHESLRATLGACPLCGGELKRGAVS